MHVVIRLADSVEAVSVRAVGQRVVRRLENRKLLIEDAAHLEKAVRGRIECVEIAECSRRPAAVLELIDHDLKTAARVPVRIAYEPQPDCIGVLKVHDYF